MEQLDIVVCQVICVQKQFILSSGGNKMKLVREITERNYIYGEENYAIENHIRQYYYDSEEERDEHSRQMQLCQWEDSGQVRKMIGGTLMPWGKNDNPPIYTWFGSYSKDEKINL